MAFAAAQAVDPVAIENARQYLGRPLSRDP
jgi:hypothetical protein